MIQTIEMNAGLEPGLRFACLLNGAGGCCDLDWQGVESWRPEDGFLWIHLERDVPEAHESSVADAERDLKNKIGAIVADLRDVAGDSDALNAIRVQVFGPWRFNEDWEETALGQRQVFGLLLHWVS